VVRQFIRCQGEVRQLVDRRTTPEESVSAYRSMKMLARMIAATAALVAGNRRMTAGVKQE
jgi:hypothetical protein